MVWNYGTEIFCSQTGRYVHIIADLRHLAKKGYEVSLCSLGIMGTKFDREIVPVSQFDILHKSTESITVQKVEPVYDVGDKIDIRVRVIENPSDLNIKVINELNDSKIEIDTWKTPPGQYNITYGSFNTLVHNSTVLKTDTLFITVLARPPGFK